MVLQLIKDKLFICFQSLVNYVNFLLLKFYFGRNVVNTYESSATVYKILFRYKPAERLDFSCKDDFISIVEESAHPEIVLKDKISLYCINAREAVLVDCGNEDIFDSAHHTFVYNAQFAIAKKMICVPLSSFYKIVSNITLPSIPLVHLPNHGRCGSTLITKLFEAMPGTLAISETNAFTDLASLSQQGIVNRDELRKICFSIIMCTVKHCNSRNSKLLFLKFQNVVTYVTDIMIETVPQIKHIYMFRQPVSFVRSYEKLLFVNNWEPLTGEMCNFWSGLGCNEILQDYPNYGIDFVSKLSSFEKFGLIWITGVAAFNKFVANGYSIKSLRYEDLISNPKETLLSIFKYVNIDENLIPDINVVMSKDSQAGTEYSSRNVDKKKMEASFSPITKELTDGLNRLCKDFNTPLFWSDIHLENNI